MADYSVIYAVLATLACVILAVTALGTLYLRAKEQQYDQLNRRIELDYLREAWERRLYNEDRKLMQSAPRWKSVNHLLLDAQEASPTLPTEARQSPFLTSLGVEISDTDYDQRKVFVLTPFHSDFDEAYRVISEVCLDVGMRCTRGDEEFHSGNILTQTVRGIMSARVVIANIDGRNPNVYYELGIAHALDRPVILVASTTTLETIPFDLRSQRIVLHNDLRELRVELGAALTRLLVDDLPTTPRSR